MRIRFAAVVATVLLSGCASRSSDPRGDDPLQAARLRYEARLNEDGTVPPNALMRAKLHRDAMIAAAPPMPEAITWSWIGPGNIGGRLRGVVIDPVNPNTMWVGACSGGIWKTTNAGGIWQPLDDFLPSLAIGCLVQHPTNRDLLFAGTGEGFFETLEGTSNTAAVRGAGIFKTTDGGTTWTQIPSTTGPDFYHVNRLAFQPGTPATMLAATTTGIWRSTDGGDTWTRVATGLCYDVRFAPGDPTRAVAGFHDEPPRYSTNGGVTWTAATGLTAHRVELAYAPSAPGTVYAAASISDRIRIYRSTDNGQTYSVQYNGTGISTYASYNSTIWVDPTNANNLMVGGVTLFRSTNAGVNITGVFGSVHADHHGIFNHPAFDGTTNRTIFIACDGGIYRIADYLGTASQELNNNLGATQYYGGAVNDATGIVIGGTQDNGTSRYSGNPEGWQSVLGGDGGYCAQDPTNSNLWYATTQRHGLRRSTNGGVNFSTSIVGNLSDAGGLNCNFIPYYMLDPNTPTRMLASGRRLWRTNNVNVGAPPTWSIIKASIEPPPRPARPDRTPGSHFDENSPYNISTIAVAKGNSDIIWVGHNNGEVWRTANGTATTPTWTRVDTGAPGLPDRWIARIAIDPADHTRVYVAIMGWAPDNVWRTTDNGATWTDISGSGLSGLPDCPVSAFNVHQTQPGRLFAGTEVGVFASDNDGATWAPAGAGLAAVPIEELIWRNNDTLLAVTHGRGMYFGAVGVPTCCVDYNTDGELDFSDTERFLANLILQIPGTCAPGADLNNDGEFDFSDIEAFLALFALGC